MENQHRKITGYRELSEGEIDLMNRIKAKGAELLALQTELVGMLNAHEVECYNRVDNPMTVEDPEIGREELERIAKAEPRRWASIAKTDIQTGIMALVRAVAQPAV